LEAARPENAVDLVLLDMKMPDMTGLEVLAKILQATPHMPVVMCTAVTDAKSAVQAMKLGAADYLNKPFDVDEIRLVVQRVIKEKALEREVGQLRTQLQGNYKFENIVGSSAVMQKMYALIQRVMDTDTTVLINGETGTGKELVARALHYNSIHKNGPFIPVHCAAIPNELLESELFGHEKGAFTGAVQRRIGMFESANGGTLFLDEIGEMSIGTQTKLLRAIQEREIRRVGSQETISINVRLVCATNRNLEEEVKNGRFREDLYYRINVVPVTLPSLRERREDIPALALHFSQRFAKDLKREVPQFTPDAMESLMNYPWPGNVRELEHAVERLLVICDSDKIDVGDLPFIIAGSEPVTAAASAALAANEGEKFGVKDPSLTPNGKKVDFQSGTVDLTKLTDDLERAHITEALQRAGGVLTKAAKSLNITRRMLRYKMNKLGFAPPAGVEESEADSPAENEVAS